MRKVKKDIYWYLDSVGGMEMFHFSDHHEAQSFGHTLREKEGDKIDVEIGLNYVRIKLLEEYATKKEKNRF